MVVAAITKPQARTVVGGARARITLGRAGKRSRRCAGAFIGIDVSKARLDVAIRPGGETLSVSNDTRGIARLVKMVKITEPKCVVLEATGGFELMVLEKLSVARCR